MATDINASEWLDEAPAPVTQRADAAAIRADAKLVKRCVAGEVAAWEQIYAQCHPPLLFSLKRMLGPIRANPELIDELAARVWYALVANDGKLLAKFDPKRRARLSTYLFNVARDILARYIRSELRRRQREAIACRGQAQFDSDGPEQDSDLADFFDMLTPSERQFLESQFSDLEDDPAPSRSPGAIWQMTWRIRKKLRGFMGLED